MMVKCLGGTGLQLLSSSVFLPFGWLAATIRGERDVVRYLPISCTSPGTDLMVDNRSVSAHHSWHRDVKKRMMRKIRVAHTQVYVYTDTTELKAFGNK